ncbi:MAG: hypothetical protein GY754_18890 [bacterium]|nr:hypothetical protein [bacterium]
MNKEIIDWLLEGPQWMQYAVKKQLLNKRAAASKAAQDSSIIEILKILKDRDAGFPAFNKDHVPYTGNLFWFLFFLADIGFTTKDLNLEKEIDTILALQSPDGRYILSKEMKPDYFCISSILLTAVIKMNGGIDARLENHIAGIRGFQRLDGGWHCAKNRAVGAKLEQTDSCPMDNLNILMLLAQLDKNRTDPALNGAIDLLLTHWDKRDEKWRPYGFGVGTQFRKLHYPAAKYGILRVLDVLSLFPYAVKNKSFQSMTDVVREKSLDGKYTAESVTKHFSNFDFGQKKEPSRWITFLIQRIEKRIALVE